MGKFNEKHLFDLIDDIISEMRNFEESYIVCLKKYLRKLKKTPFSDEFKKDLVKIKKFEIQDSKIRICVK